MSRRKMISLLILVAYCVPYVFLGMYADKTYHALWPYGLMALAMAGLGWYCVKTKRVPIALLGNLLSFLISCLLTQAFDGDDWNYFFKAFPATIRTVQFSGIMLAIQAVPWWFAKVTE